MSILRKIPKIEQVLDNMSIESLKRLESLMNSGNGATETYTLFGGENKLNYENKDLGVWYCNIELERNKSVETGFLIWESQTKALFISYDITQCLKEYEIDLTTYTYVKINEKLSIEEFRRVLEDNINKEVVHIDTTGNVEVGKNLVVDGKVILNGKADLVDTSGNELISDGGGGDIINLDKYFDFSNLTIISEYQNEFNSLYEEGKRYGIASFGGKIYPITFWKDNVHDNLFFNMFLNEGALTNAMWKIENGALQMLNPGFISVIDFNADLNGIQGFNTMYSIGNGLEIKDGALDTKEKIKIFQPNVSHISTTSSDTSKLITISITPNDMSAYDYINSLVDNNKLFNLSLYLKSAVIDNNCLTFNIPLTFVNSGTDRTRQGFSSPICVAPNILGSLTLSFESANTTINIIFYIPDDTYYAGYKQILALFTTDTILKLEIKTNE